MSVVGHQNILPFMFYFCLTALLLLCFLCCILLSLWPQSLSRYSLWISSLLCLYSRTWVFSSWTRDLTLKSIYFSLKPYVSKYQQLYLQRKSEFWAISEMFLVQAAIISYLVTGIGLECASQLPLLLSHHPLPLPQ